MRLKMKIRCALVVACMVMLSACVRLDTPHPRSFTRTVLLYIACDNNGLRTYAESDLANLIKGDLPVRVSRDEALLIFLDNGDGAPTLHRYYSAASGVVYKELVKLYDSGFNSADPDNLRIVLDDADTFYPSERRGLILWSHGTGWLPEGYYSNPEAREAAGVKSFALEGNSEMDIRDMAEAITRHYEFILFDSCLMATVEVAYQLRDKADYLIASCAEVLVDGFPYADIVSDFFYDHTGLGAGGLRNICEKYYDFYNARTGIYRSATVSLIDCSRLDELAALCRQIYGAHKEEMAQVVPSTVQRYYTGDKHWFYDLDDYVRKFADGSEYAAFSELMASCVPCKFATEKILGVITVRNHSGLSTYIRHADAPVLDAYYKTLDWTIDTGAL